MVSREVLNALPTSTVTLSNIGSITPGMAGQVNVGGSAGAYSMSSVLNVTFHGKSGGTTAYDGMRITDMDCASCTGPLISPATVDEWTVETGGGLAESDAAGVRLNVIPRSGGNTVNGSVSGSFSDSNLQTDNLTDESARTRSDVGERPGVPALDRRVRGRSAQAGQAVVLRRGPLHDEQESARRHFLQRRRRERRSTRRIRIDPEFETTSWRPARSG